MSDCRAQHDGEGRLSIGRRYPEDRIRVSRKQARKTRAGRREQPVAQLEQRVGIAIWRTAQRRAWPTAGKEEHGQQQAKKSMANSRQRRAWPTAGKEEHGQQQAKKSMANSRQRRAWPTAGIERAQQVWQSTNDKFSQFSSATDTGSSETQGTPRCDGKRSCTQQKNAFWNRGSTRS